MTTNIVPVSLGRTRQRVRDNGATDRTGAWRTGPRNDRARGTWCVVAGRLRSATGTAESALTSDSTALLLSSELLHPHALSFLWKTVGCPRTWPRRPSPAATLLVSDAAFSMGPWSAGRPAGSIVAEGAPAGGSIPESSTAKYEEATLSSAVARVPRGSCAFRVCSVLWATENHTAAKQLSSHSTSSPFLTSPRPPPHHSSVASFEAASVSASDGP